MFPIFAWGEVWQCARMISINRSIWVLAVVAAHVSFAHFKLDAPTPVYNQGVLGDPQKAPPCGNEGTPTPSNAVTTFQAGQTITITVTETIFHPGHYRVALGLNGPQDLPAEPVVTPGTTACGSAPIETNPVFPVLADGKLVHTTGLPSQSSFQVTLPSNVSCTHCTLQVIEFMSNHPLNNPGGCYYHHCAVINIVAPDAGVGMDAGLDAGMTGADAGALDAGVGADAGLDAGQTQSDAGSNGGDAGSSADAGNTSGSDAGLADAGAPDAGQPGVDAGTHTHDAGQATDGGRVGDQSDAGTAPGPGQQGCSCAGTSALETLVLAGVLMLWRRRSARA